MFFYYIYGCSNYVDMLYSRNTTIGIHIHNTYTSICGNLVNNNDELQWTNTFLYEIISLTLYSQMGWCWLCVRGELETRTDCYIFTYISYDYNSTFAFWLGYSTEGHWGPQAPSLQADSHADILSPTDSNRNWNWNWLKPSVKPGYINVWHPPASCGPTHQHRIQPRLRVKAIFRYLQLDAPVSLFFRLFNLLIDGSVEGQYITYKAEYKQAGS